MTGEQYDLLVNAGMFDGKRVELIEREVIVVPPMSEAQAQAVCLCRYAMLDAFLLPDWTVGSRLPMRLGEHSRPEPDVAVVRGSPREIKAHPTTSVLVIEVGAAVGHHPQLLADVPTVLGMHIREQLVRLLGHRARREAVDLVHLR